MTKRPSLCALLLVTLVSFPVVADDAPTTDEAAANKPDAAEDRQKQQELYELLELFVDTLDQVERNYVEDISRRDLVEAAIQGMIAKLDQHSDYIAPDDLESFRTGVESEFGGVGIQVRIQEDHPFVVTPLYGSPAHEAGMRSGDVILEIAGESAEGLTISDCVKRIKGKLGTTVELKVRHADDETETFALKRANVRVETVMGDTRNDDDSWNFMYDDELKIGYVRVSSFARHTAATLNKVVERLSKDGMQGLILDLRNNPGGLLSSAIQVSDMFVSEGKIVSTSGRNVDEKTWNAHDTATFEDFKMVVLVNQFSASASEIVSGCLQDHDRATIIGQRTWGKGSVQNIVELEAGKSALKLTTAKYLRPSGKDIHRDRDDDSDDEWGVSPNEGYDVTLSDAATYSLAEVRQQRDIIRPHADIEIAEIDDEPFKKALATIKEQLGVKPVEEESDDDASDDDSDDAPTDAASE